MRDSAGNGRLSLTLALSTLLALHGLRLCAATLYVWLDSPNPTPPYSDWATAARVIQDAVDVAEVGAEIVVTNGLYTTGGRAVEGTETNRVAVTKAVRLLSVNGPNVTVIRGAQAPDGGTGDGGIRCVYLADGASLSGFALTNGATATRGSGGGVRCASASAVLTNCVLTGNSAASHGGGSYDGTLYHCTLTGNSASQFGGGSYGGTLHHCTLTGNSGRSGGGASYSTLHNCALSGNWASVNGGAAYLGTLYNCTVTRNSAHEGGGAAGGTLYNCTVAGNHAETAGGAAFGRLYNCIVFFNQAGQYPNYAPETVFEYSCATPLPEGPGNIAPDPQLASLTHLSSNSPCLGAGSPAYASGLDIDGEPWADPPAMGADQPGATVGPVTMAIIPESRHVAIGYAATFAVSNRGPILRSVWEFEDGTVVTNQPLITHAWSVPGQYTVRLTGYNDDYPEGVVTTLAVTVMEPVAYVDAASANPVFPYASWETAATNIQDAIGVGLAPSWLVLVTNGVYRVGTVERQGLNRVALTNRVVVQSVNGPERTIIEGTTNGVRCAYVGNGAVLNGFTLTQGSRGVVGDSAGVVTNCVIRGNAGRGSSGGVLYNCVLSGNSGGGSSQGTLYNCVLTGNSADRGGGAVGSTLYNCTLTGNWASGEGGGCYGGTLYNCIVYFNQAPQGPNYASTVIEYSCTTPLPSGRGNLASDPQLVTSSHLLPTSPCARAGNPAHARGVDLDGESWADPPAMGADQPGSTVGPLTIWITSDLSQVLIGYPVQFSAHSSGPTLRSVWDFGDGTVLTNRPVISHAWLTPGDYTVRLTGHNDSYPDGVVATVSVKVSEAVYVDAAGVNPVFPYLSWETAATSIQDAIGVARPPGGLVLVTNGVYQTGTVEWQGLNRVALTNRVVVKSVNGPDVTIIRGARAAGGGTGDGAIRCAYVADGATLSGFTLADGATATGGRGGGVWCGFPNAVLTNCVLTGNAASSYGGGAYGGIFYNCTFLGNSVGSFGGGSYGGTLHNCTLIGNSASHGGGASNAILQDGTLTNNWASFAGGGSYLSTLDNCLLIANSAGFGGGSYDGTLSNCLLMANSAGLGGGCCDGTLSNCTLSGNSAEAGGGCSSVMELTTLYNCTLTENSAREGGGVYLGSLYNCTVVANKAETAGGVLYALLYNCIVYFNQAPQSPNYALPEDPVGETVIEYSCTAPLPPGPGNITTDPLLVTMNHILPTSPCARAGNRAHASGVDIDGEPWADPPAMGADQPGATSGLLTMAILTESGLLATGYPARFAASNRGPILRSVWEFDDGTVLTNQPFVGHTWTAPGEYTVRLTGYNEDYPDGVVTTLVVTVIEPVGYVDAASTNPVFPYTSWETAATNIQDVIGVGSRTVPGWSVLVTNGVYRVGAVERGGLSRVVLANRVVVKSVNGPERTIIEGTTNEVQCAYVATGSVLSGFTLTQGERGVVCEPDGVVTNCVITRNVGRGSSGGTLYNCILSGNSGGGSSQGTLYNCVLTGNSADRGGGSLGSTLYNCTLTGNAAERGGGAYGGTLYNCIVYFNQAPQGPNYASTVTEYSCTTPLPPGRGNIGSDPQLVTLSHLLPTSPCARAGSRAHARGVDIDGQPWANPPAIGADQPGSTVGPLTMWVTSDLSHVPIGYPVQFLANSLGPTLRSVWDFGDGTVLTNQPMISHAWLASGDYTVRLTGYNDSYPDGVVATVSVKVSEAVYVDAASVNPVFPYLSWETAATTIQDAISVRRLPGGLVLVTNGVYRFGSVAREGLNRVALTKRVMVKSVNGPEVTMIRGAKASDGGTGDGAIRCAYVADGATLSGFTLANGAAERGGGVWCASPSALLTNCVLTGNLAVFGGGAHGGTLYNCSFTGNSAADYGGGARDSTLYNCTLTGNSARQGGGVSGGALYNCTVAGNFAASAGGAVQSRFYNCIVYFNQAPQQPNYALDTAFEYSCTTPQAPGPGNLAADPQLASLTRLSPGSPCVGAGSAAHAAGVDIDGEPWADSPAMGADQPGAAVGPLTMHITGEFHYLFTGHPVTFVVSNRGSILGSVWDFNDGTILTNQPFVSHIWTAPGEYTVRLTGYNESHPEGVVASVPVRVIEPVGYVDAAGTNPVFPYPSWETAATNIQDAIGAGMVPGWLVLVTNGVYRFGSVEREGLNRVVLTNRVVVRSVHGPERTILEGETNGVQCAYVANGSVLSGFTLTQGSRGVVCDSAGVVTNCVITGNAGRGSSRGMLYDCALSRNSDGGSSEGTLYNCTLTANSAVFGGGSHSSTLYNCVLTRNSAFQGGGSYGGTLHNSILTRNSASSLGFGAGGGAWRSTLYNCALTGNSARHGGGIYDGTLYNCTVAGNNAETAGGVAGGRLYNCIVYHNQAFQDPNYSPEIVFEHSCTTPLPAGLGNVAADPQLITINHILPSSPCVGAGSPAHASGEDIDGEPWADPPAIGADQPGATSGSLTVDIIPESSHVAVGYPATFAASNRGPILQTVWDFDDGTFLTNQALPRHSWTAPGEYTVRLTGYNDTHPEGIVATLSVTVIESVAHVDAAGTNPVFPYTSWETAATNIQEAIGVGAAGRLVLVNPGVYRVGQVEWQGLSRVALTNYVEVRSVDGPEATVIEGGTNGMWCAYVENGSVLSGFTLTHGSGGVQCLLAGVATNCVITGNAGPGSSGGVLYNCVLSGNSGGGSSGGVLHNCMLTGNQGVGASGATLYNCTLTYNSGGGVHGGNLYNCLVYFNAGRNWSEDEWNPISLQYCCTTPPAPGTGNISADPQLASTTHLSAASPCLGAGHAEWATGVDIDGELWADPPAIGADQVWPAHSTGPLAMRISAALTEVAVGFPVRFMVENRGPLLRSTWDFGDGTLVTNQALFHHAWTALGRYTVQLRGYNGGHPDGVGTSLEIEVIEAVVHYVNVDNQTPVFPYVSWTTAATNIQDAVNAGSTPGRLVLVTNGVYRTGITLTEESDLYGTPITGTNRIALTNVVLRSVNGPAATVIDGGGQIRGVYLAGGAVLSGFTVRNGFHPYRGGGVASEAAGVVTNCLLTANVSYAMGWPPPVGAGGGISGGTLYDCVLVGNSARWGGGAHQATLHNCLLTGNAPLDAVVEYAGGGEGGGAYESTLDHCTLTGNSAGRGGGAFESTLYNCVLSGNSAVYGWWLFGGQTGSEGGGAGRSMLFNCTLTRNLAEHGAGVYESRLYNCTLTDNSGIGVQGGDLYNCVVYANQGGNWTEAAFEYSCTTPLPPGPGNLEADPQLTWGGHVSSTSPCLGAGHSAYAHGVDLDGEPWADPPAMGADQVWPEPSGSPPALRITARFAEVGVGFPIPFWAYSDRPVRDVVWDFGDGTAVTNQLNPRHAWRAPGEFTVRLTGYNDGYPEGVTSSLRVAVIEAVHYVNVANTAPVFPYTTWGTAATRISDAVNAGTVLGRTVLVTNGVYRVGTVEREGLNRVALTDAMLHSVNGPEVTIIDGGGEVRCVYLGANAVLSGFTVQNGSEGTFAADVAEALDEWQGVVTNCVLSGNMGAGARGGTLYNCTLSGNSGSGAWRSTLYNCTLTGNSAVQGGGAYESALYNCALSGNSAFEGGGAWGATMHDCVLTGNSAGEGGGTLSSTLHNCVLTGNSAEFNGGGVAGGTLYNCVLTGNSAGHGGGAATFISWWDGSETPPTLYNCTVTGNVAEHGGGVSGGACYNCIVYSNQAPQGPNYTSTVVEYSCATLLPPGPGNIAADPRFVDAPNGDYRLRPDSPCINAGANAHAAGETDLDGLPRVVAGTVDMGAYEFQAPSSLISYAWLQHYGLPTDGSADAADPDADGLNTWEEWRCLTDPTDPASVLRLLSISLDGSGVTLSWPGVEGVSYVLERSADLGARPPFTPVARNLPGWTGTNTIHDPNGGALPALYYRVGVEE